MNLTEAEIQVLAQLRGAELESEPITRDSVDKRAERYWIYREDWDDAWASLADKGLIEDDAGSYRVTEAGAPLARQHFEQRPDMYWYYFQQVYAVLYDSQAHRKLCKRVFGRNLTQEDMTDMASLDRVVASLDAGPGDRLLDLGCGAGGIAEYVAESTGAHVTGIDLSTPAIETARVRFADKGDRLAFREDDINTLALEPASFNAVYMIDSIYWVADPTDGIRRIASGIKPGGRLAILFAHLPEYCEDPSQLEIDTNYVAVALRELGIENEAIDLSDEFADFWPTVKAAAVEFRDEYVAEGNAFIPDNYIREADEEFLPAIAAGECRRYLYVATI